MLKVGIKLLGAASVPCLVAGSVAAQDLVVSQTSIDSTVNASLAALPVAPSLAFFLGGVAGLAFLARRKKRKPTHLY